MTKTLNELQKEVAKFRDEREWNKYHNTLDLTVATSIEVAEALELIRFKSREEVHEWMKNAENKKEFSHELADVFAFLLAVANSCNISLQEAFEEKMEINKKRYSVEKVKGRNDKYTEFETGEKNG